MAIEAVVAERIEIARRLPHTERQNKKQRPFTACHASETVEQLHQDVPAAATSKSLCDQKRRRVDVLT